jgi:hypothetical protein
MKAARDAYIVDKLLRSHTYVLLMALLLEICMALHDHAHVVKLCIVLLSYVAIYVAFNFFFRRRRKKNFYLSFPDFVFSCI